MLIEMMTGKIHRATVTDANIDYMGSITIDTALLRASGMRVNQKVQVVDCTNGARLETYIIEGRENSGEICLNGAAAKLIHKNDIVIIIAYGFVDENEAGAVKPKVVFVDGENKIVGIGSETVGC